MPPHLCTCHSIDQHHSLECWRVYWSTLDLKDKEED